MCVCGVFFFFGFFFSLTTVMHFCVFSTDHFTILQKCFVFIEHTLLFCMLCTIEMCER